MKQKVNFKKGKQMKKLVAMLWAVLSIAAFAGEVTATAVTAQQRYPWNGLVDITVTIQGAAEDVAKVECVFAATNTATKAVIPVEHITRNGDDVASKGVVTRKFIWDAKADVGAVKIDDIALTVKISLGGVQLWENGPYWAECNVGANRPEECGYYFWWGDTVGYKRNANNSGWISVKDSTSFSFSSGNCPTYGKNSSELQSDGYIDATGNLVTKYDAATAHLGAPWRMPTDAEFSALINNCDTEWTSRNGVSGRLVKGRGAYASKSIFLPAACFGISDFFQYSLGSCGDYWSSSRHPSNSFFAQRLDFDSSSFCRDSLQRDCGQSVRPVRGFADTESESVGMSAVTTHFAYVPPADDVTRFEGGLYRIENSPQDCEDPHGDERYIEHIYSEEDYAGCWQKNYVEIDGRKEPAAFRDNRRFGFAIPVLVASGGTITPEIVHLTSNGTYFHQIEVLSDEEFRTWDSHEGVSIPSPDPNRCWLIVLHNEQSNVKPDSNQRYRFDITKMSAANGKDMMEWTHEHGEEFPEAISLPESVSYAIRIKETGEVFPKRFWNVYNPMYDELYDAFDGDDYEEEEDYIEYPGLWLVTQEMIDEQQGITYDYEDNGDGTATLTGIYGELPAKYTIPSMVGGCTVTRLGPYLFEDDCNVVEVIIPDGVTEFEQTTFSESDIEKVTLPHTLRDIYCDEGLLYYAPGTWEGGGWSPFNSDQVKSFAFSNGKSSNDDGTYYIDGRMLLHKYDDNGTERLTLIAYAGNIGDGTSPETITVPDGIQGICAAVFDDMEDTTKISLPSSLIALGGEGGGGCAFGWTVQLQTIEVRAGSGSCPYCVIGNSLVDTRSQTLVRATKNTVIPNDGSVKRISTWAFTSDVIASVNIPDAVEEVGMCAIFSMYGCKSIYVGAGVREIHGGAFASLYGIEQFVISPDNPYYEVVNGCVVSKDDGMFVSPAVSQQTYRCFDEEDGFGCYQYDCEVPYFCTKILAQACKDEELIKTLILPKTLEYERMILIGMRVLRPTVTSRISALRIVRQRVRWKSLRPIGICQR